MSKIKTSAHAMFAEDPLFIGDSLLTVTSHGRKGERSLSGHYNESINLVHESSTLKT